MGGDKLPGGVYGTSIPFSKAMDPSQDVMVAFLYNGRLLEPDHGFPVRLIVPGNGLLPPVVHLLDLHGIMSFRKFSILIQLV